MRISLLTLRFRLAAALCGVLTVGHLLCLPWLWQVFDVYGITDVMWQFAGWWQSLPYLITVGIALCFALAGAYGLAYCGDWRPLPMRDIPKRDACFVRRPRTPLPHREIHYRPIHHCPRRPHHRDMDGCQIAPACMADSASSFIANSKLDGPFDCLLRFRLCLV
ncbi:MAG: hypothetical protein SOY26_04595 [Paludibacteraceae bacterium]|nr:hypothetical protein [Paludibacteraceae bacterium]